VVLVETALTIDTVKRTNLAVGWQQVDAKRDAESATVNRPEDGRWIDNRTHTGCKITYLNEKIEN
jgi:hypothetical protein